PHPADRARIGRHEIESRDAPNQAQHRQRSHRALRRRNVTAATYVPAGAAGGVTRRSAVDTSLSIFTGFVKYSLTPSVSAYILCRAPGFPVIIMMCGGELRGFLALALSC